MCGRWSVGSVLLLACCALFAVVLRAQTPEEVQKQAEAERQRKEALMPAEALERQRIERLDLLTTPSKPGSVEQLKQMHPDDIVKMQVLGLVWDRDTAKKVRCGRPFGVGSRDELEAVLGMIVTAPKYEPPPESGLEALPDRVLVVQPWEGEPFEIRYSSGLTEPFAGLESRALKDALHALSGGQHRITIVHLRDGEVERVIHTYAIAPHLGGHGTDWLDAKLNLTVEKGLTVSLRIHTGVEDLMKDEQPMRYGEGKVFRSEGPGTYVVVLDIPDKDWEAVASGY